MEQRKGPSLTIAIEADTNKLSAKLKAIAKHAEALAKELDAIDSDKKSIHLDGKKVSMAVFDEYATAPLSDWEKGNTNSEL